MPHTGCEQSTAPDTHSLSDPDNGIAPSLGTMKLQFLGDGALSLTYTEKNEELAVTMEYTGSNPTLEQFSSLMNYLEEAELQSDDVTQNAIK